MTHPDPILVAMIEAGGDFPTMARNLYEREGWQIVTPDSMAGLLMGFFSKDWHDDSMLARRDLVVRVVLLRARKPNTGAFTRLRAGLEGAGLAVEIDSPVGPWRRSLARQGYVGTRASHGGVVWRRS